MNDHDLLLTDFHQALQGDPDAFLRLVAPHRERIRAVCRRITGDESGAEEALAVTLAEAWPRLDSSEGASSFDSWLDRLATRSAWDVVRRRWRLTLASRPGFPSRLRG